MTKEQMKESLNNFIEDLRKVAEAAIERGVEVEMVEEMGTSTDWIAANPFPSRRYNGTATFTLKVDGGAVDRD